MRRTISTFSWGMAHRAVSREHGREGDQDSELDDPFFSALAMPASEPRSPPSPYGGDHSYWHDRSDGAWGSYVVNEVIPQVTQRFDADPQRVAVGGISMGGFGAFDLALHYPGRFGHDGDYWNSHYPEYLRFYADALRDCR
jgi:pimeloyl-ACP methyl ester carboxylesterase